VITPGHERHVHHIVISVFKQSIDSQYDNISYDCRDSSHTPGPLKGTRSIFIAWAIGGGVSLNILNYVLYSLDGPREINYSDCLGIGRNSLEFLDRR